MSSACFRALCICSLLAFSLSAVLSGDAPGAGRGSRRRAIMPRTKYLKDAASAPKGTISAHPRGYREEIRYLYEQRQRLSSQLRALEQQLEGQGFSFGAEAPEVSAGADAAEQPLEVALSTEEHPMSCRVLIEAEPGAKVIAPCNCQGTLKWIQFSEFNQLRRQEPEKWHVCNLCKAPFRTKQIFDNSGLTALALAAVLDNPKLLRFIVLTSLAGSLFVTRHLLIAAVTWFINSKYLWQTRFAWAAVVYGGFMIQLTLLRLGAVALWEGYKRLEQRAKSILTDWETKLVESSLRVNTPRQSE